MNTSLKIFALAIGLALAGGSIAEAATPVADQTVMTKQVQTPKQQVSKHQMNAVALRKHRFHVAHLRHLRKLHESRLIHRHAVAKPVKTSKAASQTKTVLANHTPAKTAATLR